MIAGLVGAALPFVLPAVGAAWLGRSALREVSASDGQLAGRGRAIAAVCLAGYSLLATIALVVGALA